MVLCMALTGAQVISSWTLPLLGMPAVFCSQFAATQVQQAVHGKDGDCRVHLHLVIGRAVHGSSRPRKVDLQRRLHRQDLAGGRLRVLQQSMSQPQIEHNLLAKEHALTLTRQPEAQCVCGECDGPQLALVPVDHATAAWRQHALQAQP